MRTDRDRDRMRLPAVRRVRAPAGGRRGGLRPYICNCVDCARVCRRPASSEGGTESGSLEVLELGDDGQDREPGLRG